MNMLARTRRNRHNKCDSLHPILTSALADIVRQKRFSDELILLIISVIFINHTPCAVQVSMDSVMLLRREVRTMNAKRMG